MIDYTCPSCGQRYSLGDEWSGREALCPKCNRVIQVPAQVAGAPAAAIGTFPQPMSSGVSAGLQPITSGMAQSLRETRPWVLFLAILGFIGCGFIVIAGLFMMAAGSHFGPRGIPAFVGFIYLGLGLLYFFPAFFLLKYSGGIRKFLDTGAAADMETALGSQKSFWRFVGILTLVCICLWLVLVVIGITAGLGATRYM